MQVMWLLGILKIPAAFAIITVCYFHSLIWETISYFEADPLNIYDFIIGKYWDNSLMLQNKVVR